MADPFDLQRFVDAQGSVHSAALAEVRQGTKRGHWMWFIFPQIAGLGQSSMARRYAIASLDEARAYLAHQVLGDRLGRFVDTLQALPPGISAEAVFGPVDAMKLRSSLTLFHRAGGEPLFRRAIDRWFGGQEDEATIRHL